MEIIRFVDLVDTVQDEQGEYYEKLIQQNYTLPAIIDDTKIDSIYPFFTPKGGVFKNVSVIQYQGEVLKVLGNYKDLNNRRFKPNTTIGFKNGQQKQETVENRTKTKSTVKRGTKGSSK